jgi:uncharacterized cupredoxin-like copper-binding protein
VRIRPAASLLAGVAVLAALGAGCASRDGDGPATVVVTVHHSRFQPAELQVRPGRTVRFVIRNSDPVDHEFILGDEAVQRRHERGTERRHDAAPGEVSVAAGGQAATTFTFPAAPGRLEYACHLPGHYAYGMHGLVTVGFGPRPDAAAPS